MKPSGYLIRQYRTGDFDNMAALYMERSREYGRTTSPEEIAETLKRPGFDPERDILLVFDDDRIIGYAHLTPETGISRVFVNGWIDPARRRKGIAFELLDGILARCRETGIRTISTSVPQENRAARIILPKLGFTMVKRYLDFHISTEKIKDGSITDSCSQCRQLHPGEEADVMALQNSAFQGHWRYDRYDLATFLYDITLNNRSAQDILVHSDGETITGYCWTESIELSGTSGTEIRGIINMIGVDTQHRRNGIGRQLLSAGLMYLKQKGAGIVSLQVDSENKAARNLYQSAGFKEYGSTLWYEREVSQDTATGKSHLAFRNSR